MNYCWVSHRGGREINEDAVLCVENGPDSCFVVADGLGAHGGGDIAARKLAEVFEQDFQSGRGGRPMRGGNRAFLAAAFNRAQAEILAQQKVTKGMKTTGVALSIINRRFAWGHIGDSRLYYFHNHKLKNRTLDHSVPQMLVIAGKIKDAEIPSHPDRNKLLRVLGDKWDTPRYDLSKERRLSKKDAFLLCSDGFWEYIAEEMILSTLGQSANAEEWLSAMLPVVEGNGGGATMDNYSAIAVMM